MTGTHLQNDEVDDGGSTLGATSAPPLVQGGDETATSPSPPPPASAGSIVAAKIKRIAGNIVGQHGLPGFETLTKPEKQHAVFMSALIMATLHGTGMLLSAGSPGYFVTAMIIVHAARHDQQDPFVGFKSLMAKYKVDLGKLASVLRDTTDVIDQITIEDLTTLHQENLDGRDQLCKNELHQTMRDIERHFWEQASAARPHFRLINPMPATTGSLPPDLAHARRGQISSLISLPHWELYAMDIQLSHDAHDGINSFQYRPVEGKTTRLYGALNGPRKPPHGISHLADPFNGDPNTGSKISFARLDGDEVFTDAQHRANLNFQRKKPCVKPCAIIADGQDITDITRLESSIADVSDKSRLTCLRLASASQFMAIEFTERYHGEEGCASPEHNQAESSGKHQQDESVIAELFPGDCEIFETRILPVNFVDHKDRDTALQSEVHYQWPGLTFSGPDGKQLYAFEIVAKLKADKFITLRPGPDLSQLCPRARMRMQNLLKAREVTAIVLVEAHRERGGFTWFGKLVFASKAATGGQPTNMWAYGKPSIPDLVDIITPTPDNLSPEIALTPIFS